jgi:hypothetical protein
MISVSRVTPIVAAFIALTIGARRAPAQQKCPDATTGELPIKFAGVPTVAAITACDLMTRLYAFADDSMRGRQLGTDDNVRATAWLANEGRRIGLKPAGEHGDYFQRIPLFVRTLDSTSTLVVAGKVFRAGVDFVANAVGQVADVGDLPVVFGGAALDTLNLLPPDRAKGALLFLRPGPATTPALTQSAGYKAYQQSLAGAILVTIAGDKLPDGAVRGALAPTGPNAVRLATAVAANRPSPLSGVVVTRALAEAMLGVPLDKATKGMAGHSVTPRVHFIDTPLAVGRNVIAVFPGSDDKLRNEFIVMGTRSDHIGVAGRTVDHDSLRAFDMLARPQGADAGARALTSDEWKQVNAMIDSLHRLHGGSRPDSINNGADAGSGAVSLLEIAEALVKEKAKPKRSILFVWHTGSERGLWGSQYFTDYPTVPRDSIVAEIDVDMVGRGAATDVTGRAADGTLLHGGPAYVQVIGARRISVELGDIVSQEIGGAKSGLQIDSTLDAAGHPQNAWCRNDQAMYATWGIPALLFTTGGHADLRMVTDEPQYIQYEKMARLDRSLLGLVMRLANLDHPVRVDRPRPADSRAACHQ